MMPIADIKIYITKKVQTKAELLGENQMEVEDDFDIMGSGLFDSMEFLVMISEIEDRFKVVIDFSEADPETMSTISGFIGAMKSVDEN